jgi:Cu+-exporting ATPase
LVLVSYHPEETGTRNLLDSVFSEFGNNLKIEVKPYDISENSAGDAHLLLLERNFFFSLVFALPMLFSAYIFPLISFFGAWDTWPLFRGVPLKFFVEFLLATPVQVWLALPVYKSALDAAWFTKKANMDTLIMLSTNVAYFYSVGVMIAGIYFGGIEGHVILEEVFFETRYDHGNSFWFFSIRSEL